jgi:hypothetical protein
MGGLYRFRRAPTGTGTTLALPVTAVPKGSEWEDMGEGSEPAEKHSAQGGIIVVKSYPLFSPSRELRDGFVPTARIVPEYL